MHASVAWTRVAVLVSIRVLLVPNWWLVIVLHWRIVKLSLSIVAVVVGRLVLVLVRHVVVGVDILVVGHSSGLSIAVLIVKVSRASRVIAWPSSSICLPWISVIARAHVSRSVAARWLVAAWLLWVVALDFGSSEIRAEH